MMFKDEYKNALNGISPDGYIKQKVLTKIETESQKTKKPLKAVMITAVAVAASLAVAISGVAVAVIIKNPFENEAFSNFGEDEEIIDVEAEEEIYTSTVVEGEEVTVSSESSITESTEKKPTENKENVPKAYLKIYEAIKNCTGGYKLYSSATNTTMGAASAEKAESVDTPTSGSTASSNFSTTNIQVKGVDESDAVKTDGKYIYTIASIYKTPNNIGNFEPCLLVIKAGKTPQIVARVALTNNSSFSPNYEMYLYNGRLVILGTAPLNSKAATAVQIYDISNPEKPKKLYDLCQSGSYKTSRMIGNKLYLISDYYVSSTSIVESVPATYVPNIQANKYNGPAKAADIVIQNNCKIAKYSVISAYNITDGTLVDSISVLGGTQTVYSSTSNIIVAGTELNGYSQLMRIRINDGNIDLKAKGSIAGRLLNQFSIDEYNGKIRLVTTDYLGNESRSNLFVLDDKLNVIGKINNIAPGEQVKSVLFMGKVAYFVTFRQVDPLFSVDLSDEESPKILGSLKIPGFSSYMFPYGEGKLLGVGFAADENTGRTTGIKLSMFDVSDPANVTEIDNYIIDGTSSEATSNHKSIFYDVNRNLIGIPHANHNLYFLLSFKNNAFVLNTTCYYSNNYDHYGRGFYINDVFYVASNIAISTIDMNNFELIKFLEYYK